jgi:hypothetical protein
MIMAVELLIEIRRDNIRTVFRKGDIIVGAEDLGPVRSARLGVRSGEAMVHFDHVPATRDYRTREAFGIPQTLMVLRPEDKIGWEAREYGCNVCDGAVVMEINPADEADWKAGKFIQHALPYLTAAERELLKTGICGPCFDQVCGEEEEDEG